MVFMRSKPDQDAVLFESGHLIADCLFSLRRSFFDGMPHFLQNNLHVPGKPSDVFIYGFDLFIGRHK
jgi:hypothetical protein